jgi:hypothetical protein
MVVRRPYLSDFARTFGIHLFRKWLDLRSPFSPLGYSSPQIRKAPRNDHIGLQNRLKKAVQVSARASAVFYRDHQFLNDRLD